MARKSAKKVTFKKFESISGIWNDTQTSEIFVNGKFEGEITKNWTPESMWASYSIDDYDVTLWVGDEERTSTFDPEDYVNARSALTAAKNWVREQVKNG